MEVSKLYREYYSGVRIRPIYEALLDRLKTMRQGYSKKVYKIFICSFDPRFYRAWYEASSPEAACSIDLLMWAQVADETGVFA